MAIVYYPSRPQRAKAPAIDYIMSEPETISTQDGFDLNSGELEEVVSYPGSWAVNTISLAFADAVSKDYTVAIINGRKVVDRENSYLWFTTNTSFPTKIELDEGFYSGTDLATELETKLDAAFSPLTFTVDYNTTTANVFTIVPSSGTIKYIDRNLQANADKQSIAGHLFGFTEDSSFSASLGSDTEVGALDQEITIASATGDSALSVINTTGYNLTIDQAIKIDITTCATTVDWTVTHEARA
jgi:hypothetical protein